MERLHATVAALPAAVAFAYPRGVPYASDSDEDLMQAYARGDEAAFEVLYGRHKARLYNYLKRELGRDAVRADDLFQAVWLRLIDARARYRADARFSAWLYRIAHNLLMDEFRRLKRAPLADSDEVLDTVADIAPGPADAALAAGQAAALRVALDALPPEQRQVFLLREDAELSLEEIATLTAVGVETVKSRWRYAVKRLRAALAEEKAS
jgi:RNA polymerase sigma factor (sigma-70 family)